MKTCSRCQRTKPLGDFNRHTIRGHQDYCRRCQVDHWREWDQERRAKAKANTERKAL